MDIGFFTNAGTETTWSLDECGAWARANDFDCVRLADAGAADTARILAQGPAELRDGLAKHGIYLSCLTAHCNLLDDDREKGRTEQARLNFSTSAASGESPIRGQGPFGTIEAEGFRIAGTGDSIFFTGKSRLLVYPDAPRPGAPK